MRRISTLGRVAAIGSLLLAGAIVGPAATAQAAEQRQCSPVSTSGETYGIYCYIGNQDLARAATRCYHFGKNTYVVRYGNALHIGPSTAYCPSGTEQADGWIDWTPTQ
ncbi:hypothetical protein [Streptomyces sp. SID13031]|uniref:hypothetical protein n=1 Tax=Streptomyces sp. SID13031 TaxID=2706046 RepID=UPI0013C57703|nr:hypothetical protein [Streptomyces sp. SID13031]NEA35087.1 hypothetical protein [Streptomyces sp. SID13031]